MPAGADSDCQRPALCHSHYCIVNRKDEEFASAFAMANAQ
jgi:hypothetical protein